MMPTEREWQLILDEWREHQRQHVANQLNFAQTGGDVLS